MWVVVVVGGGDDSMGRGFLDKVRNTDRRR